MQEFKDDNDGVSSVVEKQRKFFASAQTREFAFRSDALLKVEKYLINHREQLLHVTPAQWFILFRLWEKPEQAQGCPLSTPVSRRVRG